MPLMARQQRAHPNAWACFGHSWCNFSSGTYDQTGRLDARFRSLLDIELNNWRNYAVPGARMTIEGSSQGGWATMWREVNKQPGKGAPYSPDGGGLFLVHGINDVGLVGNTTQVKNAWVHCLRAVISRWRASTIKENSDASCTYSGFALSSGQESASGGSLHFGTTVGHTVTVTLPADYKGEPIALCWLARPGTFGAVVTYTGTAGITGTSDLRDVLPIGTLSKCPIIKRITTLTASNAGQTIIATISTVDSGPGEAYFDGWWIESKASPPVIITNCPRLTAAGYAIYSGWGGTEGQKDADVAAWNVLTDGVVAEFDGMVQIADVDTVLNKDATKFFDGLHPNEDGAALCTDAVYQALLRLTPNSNLGTTASINPASPQSGSSRLQRVSGQWYTSDFMTAGTAYLNVSGDMWAIPFEVTESRDRYNRWCVKVAATSGTGGTIRWGIYGDSNRVGYPDILITEFTTAGAFAITTATGVKLGPASGTGSYLWSPDPGLYWMTVKWTAILASQTFTSMSSCRQMPNLSSVGDMSTPGAGWKLTGQGTGVLPSFFPAGAVSTSNAPYIGVQRQ